MTLRSPRSSSRPVPTVVVAHLLVLISIGCSDRGTSTDPHRADGGQSADVGDSSSTDGGGDSYADGGRDASAPDFGDPGTPGMPWVDVTPSGRSPKQRLRPKMVYDAARQQPVLVTNGETWVWKDKIWEMVADGLEPTNRSRFALAYDAAREEVLLFGGWTENDVTPYDDTWVWDGSSWSERSPATSPPATFGHQMVYDAANERVLLFSGGGVAGLPVNEDTWAWDGTTWTLVDTGTSDPPGATASAYDEFRDVAVMYGSDGTMWELAGGVWQLVAPGAVAPDPRGDPGMVYDPSRQAILFFGGQNAGTFFTDTWTWDGSSWTDITAEVGELPGGRARLATAFDARAGGAIFYGGFGDTRIVGTQRFDDTFVIANGRWMEVSPDASPDRREGAAMTWDAARGVVFYYGGAPVLGGRAYTDSWTWDGEFWRRVVHDSLPGQRYLAGMAFDAVREQVVMFGGSQSNERDQTFIWDGAQWRLAVTTNAPSELSNVPDHLVWDAAREVVLLYQAPTLQTWTWDGAEWTLVDDVGPAGVNTTAALAYDPVRKAPVLVGAYFTGTTPSVAMGVWTWDGAAWTPVSTTAPLEVRNYYATFWDARRDSIVLFGGEDTSSNILGDTWELAGDTWTELTPDVGPPARHRHSIAFDELRGRAVLLGGRGSESESKTWEWIGSAALPRQ